MKLIKTGYFRNRILGFVLLIAGILFFHPLHSFSQSNAFDQIRKLENAEHTALLKKDTVALKNIWDKNFIVNAPINKVTPDRQHVLNLIKAGFISYTSFERNIEEMREIGDFVITMGSETVVPSLGRPRSGETIQRRFTHFWQYKNEHWRLVARHANEICK